MPVTLNLKPGASVILVQTLSGILTRGGKIKEAKQQRVRETQMGRDGQEALMHGYSSHEER